MHMLAMRFAAPSAPAAAGDGGVSPVYAATGDNGPEGTVPGEPGGSMLLAE